MPCLRPNDACVSVLNKPLNFKNHTVQNLFPKYKLNYLKFMKYYRDLGCHCYNESTTVIMVTVYHLLYVYINILCRNQSNREGW